MSHEHLGLFDTPPNRTEIRVALAIVGVLVVVFVAVLPFNGIRLPAVVAFVPTISAIIFVGELIVATLLYAQAALFRSQALTVLASGYVLSALLLVPFMLTFPGAFAASGWLHAGLNTTAWLMMFRRWAAPLSAMLYVWLKQSDSTTPPEARAPPPVLACVSAAVVLAAAMTLLTTAGHDLLPAMFVTHSEVIYSSLLAYNLSMVVLLAVAIAMLLRQLNSVLDLWLLVSLATVLAQSLLNLPLHARFTVGWYVLFTLMLVSHLVVLLALIAEFNRLYVRLALSTAARSRERDERLMSMDGVAAAISHEVGQPLAAVSLGVSVAQNALARDPPDNEKAIRSLRDAAEASQRVFAVVKSIRAMFGKRTNALTEFDLNELVLETTSLLDRDMAAQQVSLRLALDDALPPVQANRVQIQRVLVNLLANAIDSLAAGRPRARRIAIRSAATDPETLRVDISDSGPGITPEALAQIFEPFFTTKSSGTGLGLSLSRTIVEDHGGRLWASHAEDGGAIFHLELRRAPAAGG